MSDGLKWIKHDGGPMPVPGDTKIEVRWHSGGDTHRDGWGPVYSEFTYGWEDGCLNGVSEYAIVEPSQSAANTTNPDHYRTGDIECIDAIRAQLTPEQFKGYLKASLVKYVWRYEHKGSALADLEKGKWFLERLISEVRDASD